MGLPPRPLRHTCHRQARPPRSVDAPQHFHSGRQTQPLKFWVWTQSTVPVHTVREPLQDTSLRGANPLGHWYRSDPLRAVPTNRLARGRTGSSRWTHTRLAPLALGLRVSETGGRPPPPREAPGNQDQRRLAGTGRAPQRQGPSMSHSPAAT